MASRQKNQTSEQIVHLVEEALDDLKAKDVMTLNVRDIAGFTDYMVIASGTSNRHVKSLADRAQEKVRDAGFRPIGVEGEQLGEWVLVDFGDVVLHVMLPETRKFYDLERLWHSTPATPGDQGAI